MRINRPGNTIEFFYDGINRKIADVRVLRVDGQGKNPIDTSNPANPDGLIVTDYEYDLNDRLVARADDGSQPGDQNTSIGVIEAANPKGNISRYVYDDLNRMVRELMDDGTMNAAEYDADDNLIRAVDGNGNVVRKTYDGINRLVRGDITRSMSSAPHPAGGFKDPNITWAVIGTTLQQVEYDGLSRLMRAVDNNDPDDSSDDATVTAVYDSLSRKLEEVQNGLAVSSRFAGDGNRIGLVYPNGRTIALTFDHLDRINQITNAEPRAPNPVVDYDYLGPSRVLERSYSNGIRLTYLDNARQQDVGYDGVQRVVQHRHLRANNTLVAGFMNDYDRADNRVSEVKQHLGNLREEYAYDSSYRLGRFARQGEQPDTWQIDGVNNWVNRKGVTNQANNLNEYTSFAGAGQLCDDEGNLIDDGTFRYDYDFANRLRRVVRKSDNAVIAVYRYDAFGRRTERIVTNAGALNDRVRYLYDSWREIEERRAGATQQYVYGGWIDEPLVLDRDDNNDGVVDRTFFYHQDAKTYVAALTDATGAVVDQVMYDAYGLPSSLSAVGNPYLFTGRRYDPETGFYYYRTRYYDPLAGRFITRDTIGMWGDEAELGNGYSYVSNAPMSVTDPLGLALNLNSSKSNIYRVAGGSGEDTPGPLNAINLNSSKSNIYRVAGSGAEDPPGPLNAINLNSSKSNIYRVAEGGGEDAPGERFVCKLGRCEFKTRVAGGGGEDTPGPLNAINLNSSKSNIYRVAGGGGEDTPGPLNAINLNSSKSNIYRVAGGGTCRPTATAQPGGSGSARYTIDCEKVYGGNGWTYVCCVYLPYSDSWYCAAASRIQGNAGGGGISKGAGFTFGTKNVHRVGGGGGGGGPSSLAVSDEGAPGKGGNISTKK
jgi:RHS repeat-associated protein